MLDLSHGPWTLRLDPELGGAVDRLTFEGRDVLRPTPPGAADVLQTGSFPLVPFANRIAHGRFSFGGRQVQLSPNLPGHPHPLHGQGWRGAWTVTAAGEAFAELAFRYAGGEWPWPYEAAQAFELSDDGVVMRLSAVNLSGEPAPMGLGFHPCFPGKRRARLQADVTGVWLTDDLCLATRHLDGSPFADWTAGASVDTPGLVDHCHTGWSGAAAITLGEQGLAIAMTASPELGFLHIYTPPALDSFCVEPVSHRPDALNAADPQADGMKVLAPGERWSVEMILRAELL